MSAERPPRAPVASGPGKGRRSVRARLSKGEQAALRTSAELMFTLDLKNLSVAQVAARDEFSGVSPATLAAWAKADDWEGKRRANRKMWADQLRRRFSDQLIHHRYDELMRLKHLQDQAYSYALGSEEGAPPAPPKTFAEAAKLYVTLDQALTARRDALLEGFGVAAQGAAAPPSGPDGATPDASRGEGPAHSLMQVPEMDDDEYQELAHHMMARGFTAEDGPTPVPQSPKRQNPGQG